MFASILPLVAKTAIESAKVVTVVTGVVYGINRVVVGKRMHAPNDSLKQKVKDELAFAGGVGLQTAKEITPTAVLLSAAGVVAPINPPLAGGLFIAGVGISVYQTSKSLRALYHEAGIDQIVAEHRESKREVVVDEVVDKVHPETHALWDAINLEDEEIDLQLAELDLERFKRTPHKAGAEFAERLGAEILKDEVKRDIVRRALHNSLVEHAVSPNKVAQAVKGFDRVAGELVA